MIYLFRLDCGGMTKERFLTITYSQSEHYPVAKKIGQDGLWLPSSSQLRYSDILRICNAIRDFYE